MDLEGEPADPHRALGAVPLHEWRELAGVARRGLIPAEDRAVLQHGSLVRERARARDGRLHVEEHLRDHRVLADRLAHLDAGRRVLARLRQRGGRDTDPLDADAEPRLVHEREDLFPPIARLPERGRARSLEDERARRRAADDELVLGALDDVVVTLAVGDEHPEPIESRRPRDAASEHDHHVPLARGDELLASFEEPAIVACGCRRRRDVADIRSRLRLGHRDRPHEPTLGEDRQVPRLLLLGAEAEDERRRRVPPDAVLDLSGEVGPREHLGQHHRHRERQPRAAELGRDRW